MAQFNWTVYKEEVKSDGKIPEVEGVVAKFVKSNDGAHFIQTMNDLEDGFYYFMR